MKRAQVPQNTPLPVKSRTTNLGPFGEVLRATGPMAKANPFRFSTKYQDDETDLLYYGYRYYNASTGRWLSRDPAEEFGGLNVYGFVDNAPIDEVDAIGLAPHLSYGTVEKSAGDCGQFVWRTKWQLSGLIFHKKTKVGSIVVQHVTWTIDIRDANGNRVGPATPAPIWEGWTVNKGQSVTTVIEAGGKYDDEWSYGGAGDGTKGTITISGDASFYDGLSLPPSFTVDPSRPSGDLPSTTTDPGLSGGSGNVGRNLTAKWDCICVKDAKDKKTKLKTK